MTEGYTPSDITALCSAAANIPVQERLAIIRKANSRVKPPAISAIQTVKEKEEKEKKGVAINVTQTPDAADNRRTEKAFAFGHNRWNRCQMIGFDGVFQPQQKAET